MIAKQCYSVSLQAVPREVLSIKVLDTKDEEKVVSIEMADKLLQLLLDSRFLEQIVKISLELCGQESVELEEALK